MNCFALYCVKFPSPVPSLSLVHLAPFLSCLYCTTKQHTHQSLLLNDYPPLESTYFCNFWFYFELSRQKVGTRRSLLIWDFQEVFYVYFWFNVQFLPQKKKLGFNDDFILLVWNSAAYALALFMLHFLYPKGWFCYVLHSFAQDKFSLKRIWRYITFYILRDRSAFDLILWLFFFYDFKIKVKCFEFQIAFIFSEYS